MQSFHILTSSHENSASTSKTLSTSLHYLGWFFGSAAGGAGGPVRSQRKAGTIWGLGSPLVEIDTSLYVVPFFLRNPCVGVGFIPSCLYSSIDRYWCCNCHGYLVGTSALSTTGLVRAVVVCIRDCRCHRVCFGASACGFLCTGMVVIVVVCWSPGCGVFAVVVLVARFLFGLLCFFSSPYPAYHFLSSRSHIFSYSVQAPHVYCREQSTCNYSTVFYAGRGRKKYLLPSSAMLLHCLSCAFCSYCFLTWRWLSPSSLSLSLLWLWQLFWCC